MELKNALLNIIGVMTYLPFSRQRLLRVYVSAAVTVQVKQFSMSPLQSFVFFSNQWKHFVCVFFFFSTCQPILLFIYFSLFFHLYSCE